MKLYVKVQVQEKIIETYEKGIRELISYLNLPKFYRPNNYVNISDISLRLEELKNYINQIEIEEEQKINNKNRVGNIKMIYNDPTTEKKEEGRAKLLKCIISRKEEEEEYWRVKFLSDDFIADRWIKK